MRDLVAMLDLNRHGDTPVGIERTEGMCVKREGSSAGDVAFKITQRAVASIPAADIFPDGFPAGTMNYELELNKIEKVSCKCPPPVQFFCARETGTFFSQ